MQAVIYAGLRNGARDQQIHDALTYKHVAEVAQDFKLSPNTIRAASKRIANATVYELSLLGGVAQCRLVESPQTASARLHSVHTAATTAPFATLSCLAG
ncbi:hypothetical protein SAMN04488482_6072 [Pseudomonas chlororaphis]|uniref:hypothetical protein n=1 Tax=Pseudomonas chlororaphis TaxID=587753 RepID=UPI000F6EAC47|nr:hypothetical protein [Pseudomonas chlororaphis]AZD01344.1 hypothetical protein C4K27_2150 [Pseudomonas chlororaphis subsp. chlororaphis]SMQ10814.1 hypothetical protein SAMN04488482_6072 [Pseudomonas chlororaphis]